MCQVLLDSCNTTTIESVYATDWDTKSSLYEHSVYVMTAIKNTNMLSGLDTMFDLSFENHNMVSTAVQSVLKTASILDIGPEMIFNTAYDYRHMVSTVVQFAARTLGQYIRGEPIRGVPVFGDMCVEFVCAMCMTCLLLL